MKYQRVRHGFKFKKHKNVFQKHELFTNLEYNWWKVVVKLLHELVGYTFPDLPFDYFTDQNFLDYIKFGHRPFLLNKKMKHTLFVNGCFFF